MPVLSNRKLKLRLPVVAVCISAACSLTASPAIAQTPVAQAWTVLHEGATDKSAEQRQATMRVLRLIPGNAAAVSLAEEGLKDKDRETRGAAALSLGAMDSKSAIPSLLATAKGDTEGSVVMAAAKSLIQLGDEKGYTVYYAILTGQRKSGAGLIGSQEKQLDDLMRHPEQMEDMAFEQGMGFRAVWRYWSAGLPDDSFQRGKRTAGESDGHPGTGEGSRSCDSEGAGRGHA